MTELPGVFLSSFLFSVSQICSCLIFSDMPLARASTHAPHVYEEKFAFQSLTYKVFEIGDFSDGISGALGRPAAQSPESEKYRINDIFHSFVLRTEVFFSAGASASAAAAASASFCALVFLGARFLAAGFFSSASAGASAAASAASASF